jgi:RNA polymerase sigma-70 factor, ECF subfamily
VMDNRDPAIRELVQRLTSCQPRLYAYIMAMLLDHNRAEDVLQQTNLVIWEKAADFVACDNFESRACKVAYFQVLAARRDKMRDQRRMLFDEKLLAHVAQAVSKRVGSAFDDYLAALRDCTEKLSEKQRDLLRQRYAPGGSVNAIAVNRGESPDITSASLYRIRKKLQACILQNMEKKKGV